MSYEQIQQLRRKQEALLSTMDAVARQFIAATAQQLASQLLPVAKRICQRQQDVNKRLGEEGLQKLVADIQHLASRMPEICSECFYRDTAWLHLNWKKEHRYRHDPRTTFPLAPGERTANQINGWSFIDAIDYLGDLLARAGYSTNTAEGYDGYSVAHSSLYRQFTWSPEMDRLYKQYSELESELWKQQREIEEMTSVNAFDPTQEFWKTVSAE